MNTQAQQVISKLEQLSPERLAEVEDFIDFLQQRDGDRVARKDLASASERAFATVWNNEEDAIYDDV